MLHALATTNQWAPQEFFMAGPAGTKHLVRRGEDGKLSLLTEPSRHTALADLVEPHDPFLEHIKSILPEGVNLHVNGKLVSPGAEH